MPNDPAVQHPSAHDASRNNGRQLGTIGCIAQLAVAFGAAAMESLAGPV